MRDQRFKAEHREGSLTKIQHRLLILWACVCAENVMHLLPDKIDDRLNHAIQIAKDWAIGKASVSDARQCSLQANSVASESSDPTEIAVARSVAHAVATAHMADHSIVAAWYALKAVKNAGKSIDAERAWQNSKLPSEIKEFVLSARAKREKDLKLEMPE